MLCYSELIFESVWSCYMRGICSYFVCGSGLLSMSPASVSNVRRAHRASKPDAHVATTRGRLAEKTTGGRPLLGGRAEVAGEVSSLPRFGRLRSPADAALPPLAARCVGSYWWVHFLYWWVHFLIGEFISSVGELISSIGELISSIGEFNSSIDEFIFSIGEFIFSNGEFIFSIGEFISSIGEFISSIDEFFHVSVTVRGSGYLYFQFVTCKSALLVSYHLIM